VLNTFKSISIGVITIIVLGLVNQLLLIMSLVGYGSLSKIYPFLTSWSQIFTYAIGGGGYFIVMLIGGIVTARLASSHPYLKTMTAAIIGSSFSLSMSLKDEFFTPIALFFILFGITSSIIGCRLWAFYLSRKIDKL